MLWTEVINETSLTSKSSCKQNNTTHHHLTLSGGVHELYDGEQVLSISKDKMWKPYAHVAYVLQLSRDW